MDLQKRPKLKLPKTRWEVFFDGITIILLLLCIIYLTVAWESLPSEVPAHYNAAGEVDRWGKKWEMIIIPVIAVAMWISMTVLEKYPHVYNYSNLTKENVKAQYINARTMLNVIKNTITILFAYITWNDIQVSLGRAETIGVWFIPFFFIVILGPMIFFIIRSSRL